MSPTLSSSYSPFLTSAAGSSTLSDGDLRYGRMVSFLIIKQLNLVLRSYLLSSKIEMNLKKFALREVDAVT